MAKSIRQQNLDLGNVIKVPLLILKTSKLSTPAKILYWTILAHCGDNDFCCPSQNRLGKDVGGRHPHSIKASLEKLVEVRLIKYENMEDGPYKMITLLPIEKSVLVEN